MKEQEFHATVTVRISVPEGVEVVIDSSGNPYAWKDGEGNIIEPAFCIRIEREETGEERFAFTDLAMQKKGCTLISYEQIMLSEAVEE